ncbi:MAG: hypothetical protein IJQ80_01515, partial [Clostridia bacterium]|nr:hypothetical protein [Clostridia bacterium]
HPNYAIYLAEKNTLTVKAFNELLQSIPPDDRARFSKEKAEKYYREYQESYTDDKDAVEKLASALKDRKIVILAPGKSLLREADRVRGAIDTETAVIAANFLAQDFSPDYIFSSNMRRFVKIQGRTQATCIITSNMKEATQKDLVVNFASYASKDPEIIDNSVLMLLKLLTAAGVKEVNIAGMDGYSETGGDVYYDSELDHDFSREAKRRNAKISEELKEINRRIKLTFITNTMYNM